MLDKRQNNDNILYHDMPLEDQYEWFGYTHKKFLHNIDTFYYSVKFRNDFRLKSKDPQVEKMRKFFKLQYSYLNGNEDQPELYLPKLGKNLYLKPVTFSRFYTTCLSYPEYFDIFLAPVVPKAADGGESVTCECVVQIRSYMLWIMGVKDAFENSYEYVKNIAAYFGLEIDFQTEVCSYVLDIFITVLKGILYTHDPEHVATDLHHALTGNRLPTVCRFWNHRRQEDIKVLRIT